MFRPVAEAAPRDEHEDERGELDGDAHDEEVLADACVVVVETGTASLAVGRPQATRSVERHAEQDRARYAPCKRRAYVKAACSAGLSNLCVTI